MCARPPKAVAPCVPRGDTLVGDEGAHRRWGAQGTRSGSVVGDAGGGQRLGGQEKMTGFPIDSLRDSTGKNRKHIRKDTVRREMVKKDEHQRMALKSIQKNVSDFSTTKRFAASIRLSKLRKNGSKVKVRNRCVLTGRPRGVYNFFKLSRIMIRDLVSKGLLPGVVKASW